MDQDIIDNIFERQQLQVAPKSNTKVGKPPTRLQKHAPATLQLNQAINNPFTRSDDTPLIAIPLLSPLVVSPKLEAEEFRFPAKCCSGNEISIDDNKSGAAFLQPGGWQHPAVVGYGEPSSLFACFQSKCVLVNNAQ